jgi:hypothetical protein
VIRMMKMSLKTCFDGAQPAPGNRLYAGARVAQACRRLSLPTL